MSRLRRVGDGGDAAGAFGAFSGDGNGGLETGGGVLLPEGIEGEGAAEELAQKGAEEDVAGTGGVHGVNVPGGAGDAERFCVKPGAVSAVGD